VPRGPRYQAGSVRRDLIRCKLARASGIRPPLGACAPARFQDRRFDRRPPPPCGGILPQGLFSISDSNHASISAARHRTDLSETRTSDGKDPRANRLSSALDRRARTRPTSVRDRFGSLWFGVFGWGRTIRAGESCGGDERNAGGARKRDNSEVNRSISFAAASRSLISSPRVRRPASLRSCRSMSRMIAPFIDRPSLY
jgi:hypothetical protein